MKTRIIKESTHKLLKEYTKRHALKLNAHIEFVLLEYIRIELLNEKDFEWIDNIKQVGVNR